MINVAFLLLIFFLMVAVIAPPDPLAVVLPDGATEQDLARDADRVLFVALDGGVLARDGTPASLTDVTGQSVVLRADARVDAGRVATIIGELSVGGAASVQLAIAPN